MIGKLRDVSFDAFASCPDLRDLVIYRLQCVSEATKNVLAVDSTIADRYPEIPWRDVRDIGNLLRHDYKNVDAEVVWETVTSGELRALVTVAKSEQSELSRFDPSPWIEECGDGDVSDYLETDRRNVEATMNAYPIILECAADGGWSAMAPDLPGLLLAADTREQLLAEAPAAIADYLDGLRKEHLPIPEPGEVQLIQFAV